jgi:endonuclease YncB( thermonuclease family)
VSAPFFVSRNLNIRLIPPYTPAKPPWFRYTEFMKLFLASMITLLTLSACGAGGSGAAAEQTAAVNTQVALFLQQLTATAVAAQGGLPQATEALVTSAPAPETNNSNVVFAAGPEADCANNDSEPVLALVTEVWSGDSIEVDINGQRFEVRYIGLDDGDSEASLAANTQLVLDKQVWLIRDVSDVDQYGRLPRYVIADGVFVNHELIRTGAAFLSIEEPDLSCRNSLESAQP